MKDKREYQVRILISILVLSLSLGSCKDFIAKNISGKTPVLLTPIANDSTVFTPVSFNWEVMEGATKYRLIVVSPSFSNMKKYVLDTLVTKNSFLMALDSNAYEIKLQALNAGYESQILGPIKFKIGKTFTNQPNKTLQLVTPSAGKYVNQSFDGKFSWQAIATGTNYEFELRKGESFTTGSNIYTMDPGNTLDKTLPSNILPLKPGAYTWRVIANAGSAYLTQTVGTFFVDTLVPNTPILQLPVNNSLSISRLDSVQFQWNNGIQLSTYQSPVSSNLEIASDQNFTTIILSNIVLSQQSKKILLNTLVTGKTYFWRVSNSDAAGNHSLPSSSFQFTIF